MKPTISESGIQDIRGKSISKVRISLRRTNGQMFARNGVVTVRLGLLHPQQENVRESMSIDCLQEA